jgi:hypothetical protein
LCSQQKPTRGGSGRAAREVIAARSRDRPNYTNLLHYMLHYTLGSLSAYAALRTAISRPVCFGIKHPSWGYDQKCITVRYLNVCSCGMLSLTRGGSVDYNCCWPSPVQSLSSLVVPATIFYCFLCGSCRDVISRASEE